MILPGRFRVAPACLRALAGSLVSTFVIALATGAHGQGAVSLPTIEVTGEQAPSTGATQADLANQPVSAASELNIGGQQINQRSFERPAEVLEVIPGLIITQHSGEGKANQYFLRGYNLDHGTDLAIWVDGMPCNMRTHAHGQGYCDLNFLIPELINSANVRKGPYWADEGDFASVGNVHISLIDKVDKTIALSTLGSFDYRRLLGITSKPVGEGNLLVAAEAVGYDGPWTNFDNMAKLNGVVRFTQGTPTNGFSVTGWAYANNWNSTDQIPLRAVTTGVLGLYDAFDPADGGNTSRFSVSGHWAQTDERYATNVDFYAIKYSLNLWNDFTYVLVNPIDKDQFHQHDDRFLTGLSASHIIKGEFTSLPTETSLRFANSLRCYRCWVDEYGRTSVPLQHPQRSRGRGQCRVFLPSTQCIGRIGLKPHSAGAVTSIMPPSTRSTTLSNSGSATLAIGSPKFRAVLGPFYKTELFLDAGEGFHSNDARGVMTRDDPLEHTPLVPSPFLVRQPGAEVGFGRRPSTASPARSVYGCWMPRRNWCFPAMLVLPKPAGRAIAMELNSLTNINQLPGYASRPMSLQRTRGSSAMTRIRRHSLLRSPAIRWPQLAISRATTLRAPPV